MVNFGKRLMADQLEEWKDYYINYKMMKKKVKQYVQQTQNDGKDREQVHKEFSRMLDDQIEKIVLFLLQQQGHLASRIEKLGEERALLMEQSDASQISELREAYRQVGFDLMKLLRFVDMNATGIRKILKKFDKRFGYKFTDYYVSTRANHPCSQLQQIFKQVGIVAVVGALSRNLAFLQDHQGNFPSIYDHPSITLKDPIIEQINHSVQKLTHATNLLQFIGQHALIIPDDMQIGSEDLVDDQSYHFMSLLLNLANTFLYMVNTYIIVPTADDYSVSLGAAATVCGVIIGSMAVAQVFSSVYFSAWSNKSYFRPLVFSSIMLFLGNLLYALAYDVNSLTVLIVGRLLCGLGSARAVNRRYISDCVPLKTRLKASAGFVSASALGMACGPALAGHGRNGNLEDGLAQPFLIDAKERLDENGEDNDDNNEDLEDSHKPATSLAAAYRLLTPSVKVQLLIYFMLKFAMEILLSESSVVTTFYFNWQILVASEIMVLIGIAMSFRFNSRYSVPQYVSSALITFVFAEVLEGVNLSLLSRVMSSRLSRGTYNGGLLSTEAGTLARVAADMTITAAGYLGQNSLLNVTLLPSFVICVASIVATFCTYNSLY
uniref:SPX domain-containing protein n=1 Tax=Leersia perrieri TaxID=77586 RepID=A0A0D9VJH5_9ORYZ